MRFVLSLFLFVSQLSFAETAKLVQVKSLPIKESILPGYNFDADQAFQILTGPLKNKYLFFASRELGSVDDSKLPRFIISDYSKFVDSIQTPDLVEGTNLVSVIAVSSVQPKSKIYSLRILAVLTLAPLSYRESDYWEKPYVFDVNPEGKIEPNIDLNKKMSQQKKRPKNIKEIRKFLDSL